MAEYHLGGVDMSYGDGVGLGGAGGVSSDEEYETRCWRSLRRYDHCIPADRGVSQVHVWVARKYNTLLILMLMIGVKCKLFGKRFIVDEIS